MWPCWCKLGWWLLLWLLTSSHMRNSKFELCVCVSRSHAFSLRWQPRTRGRFVWSSTWMRRWSTAPLRWGSYVLTCVGDVTTLCTCERERERFMANSVLLQPIDNADFIVPVEIEGTTHQVHPRFVCIAYTSVHVCWYICSRWNGACLNMMMGEAGPPCSSSLGRSPVQVIQDRLVPCRLGLLSITCFRKRPPATNEHTHTHGRTSRWRWRNVGMLLVLMTFEILKPCGVIYRCTFWKGPTWTSSCSGWASCLSVCCSPPAWPRWVGPGQGQ